MTDKIKGLIVTLDQDYRDDDCQQIVNAIEMIKGVISVDMRVYEGNDLMNRVRIKHEVTEKLRNVIKEI